MNVKIAVGDIVRLLGKNVPMEQVCAKVCPIAQRAGILFPEPKIGIGYIQWYFYGDDWVSYEKLEDKEKEVIADLYMQRKAIVQKELGDSPLFKTIFTVPSKQFIYVRKNDKDYDIALGAWAVRFPNALGCSELVARRTIKEMQKVSIGFTWNGELLENFDFKIQGQSRKTSEDGLYRIDGLFEVGRKLHLNVFNSKSFNFTVELGKEDYIFDITQYYILKVSVSQDGQPMINTICNTEFNGVSKQIVTDNSGIAQIKLYKAFSKEEGILNPQPNIRVLCNSEVQDKIPDSNDEIIVFNFDFITEHPQPVQALEPKIEENIAPDPEPEIPSVTIELLDYGGYPLKNIDFVLKTKKCEKQIFKTDENGMCMIPKEYFTNKKNFKIEIEISPQYQSLYDLHDTKEKK